LPVTFPNGDGEPFESSSPKLLWIAREINPSPLSKWQRTTYGTPWANIHYLCISKQQTLFWIRLIDLDGDIYPFSTLKGPENTWKLLIQIQMIVTSLYNTSFTKLRGIRFNFCSCIEGNANY
jgi:hypothetical protein